MSHINVIIVESQPIIGELFRSWLERDGIKALVATDCDAARRMINFWQPDLVLIDREIAGRMTSAPGRHADPESAQSPALLLTRWNGRDCNGANGRIAGTMDDQVEAVIAKPVARDRLLAAAQSLIAVKQNSSEIIVPAA